MGNAIVAIIGIALLAGGIAGISLITIPSFENIGKQAQNVSTDNSTGKIIAHVASAALSGVVLWLTTGALVVLSIAGVIVFIYGLVC